MDKKIKPEAKDFRAMPAFEDILYFCHAVDRRKGELTKNRDDYIRFCYDEKPKGQFANYHLDPHGRIYRTIGNFLNEILQNSWWRQYCKFIIKKIEGTK